MIGDGRQMNLGHASSTNQDNLKDPPPLNNLGARLIKIIKICATGITFPACTQEGHGLPWHMFRDKPVKITVQRLQIR